MIEIGQILQDRFEILRPIGDGAQGTYLAQDRLEGREVVVKAFVLGHAADGREIRRVSQGYEVLQSLDHRAIPAYIDGFYDDEAGCFFVVQRFVDGENLGDRVELGLIFGDRDLRDFLQQMLSVLEYLGESVPRVVHGDLKPSNILVDGEGNYSLIAFEDHLGGSTVRGTPGYIAPEQETGLATPATDVYALAATAVHLIAGIHPADLPMEQGKLQFRDVIGFSGPLLDVLDGMLEPQMEQRLSRVSEIRRAMEDPDWGGVGAAVVPSSATASEVASPTHRHPRPIATLMERAPITNPFSHIRLEGDALVVETSSQRTSNQMAALIAAGLGVGLTVLGCATGFGFLCCVSLPLLVPGVPLIAFYWDQVVGPKSERLAMESDGIRITSDQSEVYIPLSKLRSHRLNVVETNFNSTDIPEDMPVNIFQKPGIAFVDEDGNESIFGTSVITRGKLTQGGHDRSLNIKELEWIYEMVESRLADDPEPEPEAVEEEMLEEGDSEGEWGGGAW